MPNAYIIASSIIIIVAAALLAGCVTDKPTPEPHTFGYDRAMLPNYTAPAEMEALTGVLIRYRAVSGRLPETLDDLADTGLMSADEVAALPEYGYSAWGMGVLADGSLIVLVDSQIRVPNQAWCIVLKPTKTAEPTVLMTQMVPMSQLRVAARAAK